MATKNHNLSKFDSPLPSAADMRFGIVAVSYTHLDVYKRQGLGITAEGDMLAALGLRYGTQEAIDFAVEVQKCHLLPCR